MVRSMRIYFAWCLTHKARSDVRMSGLSCSAIVYIIAILLI